jgi:hypothetical protein
MVGPGISPEDGVSRYASDYTQGPACAMAAGAGTIFRNDLVPLAGGRGQTAQRRIDTLAELGAALGHDERPLWTWRNGYALCSDEGLARASRPLAAADAAGIDRLRALLRIGLHWDVEVTDAATAPGPLATQAYCSALPVAYGGPPRRAWEPLARLVLEAAYEATLLAQRAQRPPRHFGARAAHAAGRWCLRLASPPGSTMPSTGPCAAWRARISTWWR